MHPELPKDEYRPNEAATKTNETPTNPFDQPLQASYPAAKNRNKSKMLLIGALVLIFGSAIGLGIGYYFHQNSPKTAQSQIVPATGTTASIDSLMIQDANSETSIDNQQVSNNQTNAQSANAAASNVGGAYDESNF